MLFLFLSYWTLLVCRISYITDYLLIPLGSWGGGRTLSTQRIRLCLVRIQQADSVVVDLHTWAILGL